MKKFFSDGQTVLFQGDSITDSGRDYSDENSLGEGYVKMFAQRYIENFADSGIKFINKGVSGDRVHNLIERYPEDILDVQPDFISILVGINDVWRRYDSNDPSTPEAFEDHYEYLLKMLKHHMPETKILVIEPFLLHVKPELYKWREDLDPKIIITRKLAAAYADFYLPLDGVFASLSVKKFKPEDLAHDGVHPTKTGHEVIAGQIFNLLATH